MDSSGVSASILAALRDVDAKSALEFIAITFILYIVTYCVYQVYFHPLSKYPGPWLNAITRTRLTWSEITGDVRYSDRVHKKYGRIVRISPNEISLINAGAWKDIYFSKTIDKDPVHFQMEKPPGYPENLNTCLDMEAHRRLREAFRPAFSDKMLRNQEAMILDNSELMIKQMRARVDQKLDLVKFFNLITFDIMHYMCFSQRLGQLESAEYSPWVRAMFSQLKGWGLGTIGRKQPIFRPIVKYFVKTEEVGEAAAINFLKSTQMIDQELANAEKGEEYVGNIWATIKKADKEGSLAREDFYINSAIFMLAGTETSATALSSICYYLTLYPDVLAKLQKEIRGTFRHPSEINMKTTTGLKYLNACLQETMRMFPPAPTGNPRIIPPGGEKVH